MHYIAPYLVFCQAIIVYYLVRIFREGLNSVMEPFSLIWASENQGAVRVDDWPNAPRTYKTIAIHTHDFSGSVRIEGTIELDPNDGDWFEVGSEEFIQPETHESKIQNRIMSTRDRIIWMRATVVNNYGRVDRVLVM